MKSLLTDDQTLLNRDSIQLSPRLEGQPLNSVQALPQPTPAFSIHDFIDPATYGFSAIAPFSQEATRVSQLDDVWFRQDTIAQLVSETEQGRTSGRRDGLLVLALEAPLEDRQRVACMFSGRIVGYLAQADFDNLLPSVNALLAHRRHLEIQATLSIQHGRVAVFVHVPGPACILPANGYPPEKWMLLPGGNPVELNVKSSISTRVSVPNEDAEILVTAVVKSVVEIRARSAMETFEVFVNGQSCGLVPPSKASASLALIKVLESRGVTPLMRTALSSTPKGLKVTVDTSSFEALNPHIVDSILG